MKRDKDIKDDINYKSNSEIKKKKSLLFFIFNIAAVFVVTAAVMYFSPTIAPRLIGFNENAAAVFAPVEFVKENKETNENITLDYQVVDYKENEKE